MAVRVLLLISFTGLFAAIWGSDGPGIAGPMLASETQRLPDGPVAVEDIRRTLDVPEVGRAVTITPEFNRSLVTLPEAITAGTYRVVDAQGQVGWMTISTDEQFATADVEIKPLYSSESAHGRWYFIRVEAVPIIASPQAGTAVQR